MLASFRDWPSSRRPGVRLRNAALSALLCFLFCGHARAITSIDTTIVNKSVVFFFAADAEGNVRADKHDATGFLIAVHHKDGQTIQGFLVTARHVVDPVWAGCASGNPTRLFARANKKRFDPKTDRTGVAFLPIELVKDGKPTWSKSEDDSIDVAVLNPPQDLISGTYDVRLLNFGEFGSPEEIAKLGVGSQISSSGLVPGVAGKNRNNPVFQFGKVASIPDEMATLQCKPTSVPRLLRVWWVAASLVPGTSGSPILFDPMFPPGAAITAGEPRAMIIGLQSLSLPGANLAGMTPVKYIVDVITQMCAANGEDLDLTLGPRPKTEVPKPAP